MNSVIDASAFTHALTSDDETARVIIDAMGDNVFVPEHMRSECANAIRGMFLGGKITGEQRDELLTEIASYPFTVVDFGMFYEKSIEYYRNLSAYDSAYVALAELVDARLITLDMGIHKVAAKTMTVIP